MNHSNIIFSLLMVTLFVYAPADCISEQNIPEHITPEQRAAEVPGADDKFVNTIEPSSNQIIKLTDQGLNPQTLRLKRAGGSVFFLNHTSQSLLGLEIDYGKKLSYCASGKMMMGEDGKFRSLAPFAPRGFVSVCFPHAGKYPVKVYGMAGQSARCECYRVG